MKARVAIAIAACLLSTMRAAGVDASDRYRSPRNPERKIRKTTELIVLHTTEGAARGSLNKLSERGECHFCVTEDGTIYRIVDRDREAFHAGRSMWRGKEDVDAFSIGIECVGWHDKPMPVVQLTALANLVKDLKGMYSLSDDKVVCHSHVAYGAPNKWQKKKHRGRKRCGMLFAMPSVRRILGLKSKPRSDADVAAKRLAVGDEYLRGVLYGKTDTMAAEYAKAKKPNKPESGGTGSVVDRIYGKLGGGRNGKKKSEARPKQADRPSIAAKPTRAAKPKTKIPEGFKAPPRSIAELKARGYVRRGEISRSRTALQIVGKKWNSHETYYTIRNKVIPGNMLNPAKVEVGTAVWTKP